MVEENRNSQFIGSFKYGCHPSSMGQNNGVFGGGAGVENEQAHRVYVAPSVNAYGYRPKGWWFKPTQGFLYMKSN